MEDIIPASAMYVGSVGHYAVCVHMLVCCTYLFKSYECPRRRLRSRFKTSVLIHFPFSLSQRSWGEAERPFLAVDAKRYSHH